MILVQVQWFRTGTRYKLEVLHQCKKRVKTKIQKVLGANSYVCRSYRGKTSRGDIFGLPSCIGLILRIPELFSCQVCEIFVYKHTETTEYVKKKQPTF